MPFSINGIQLNETRHTSIECGYTECSDYLSIMLSVIMLNVIMLNVIMLNVIMLNVIMLNVIMLNVVRLSVVAPHE